MNGFGEAETSHVAAGLKHFANGGPAQAAAAFQRAIAAAPAREDVLYYLGAAILQSGRPLAAIKILHRAWRASPNNPAAANLLALALRCAGRPNEAATACQAALALCPAAADDLFRPVA